MLVGGPPSSSASASAVVVVIGASSESRVCWCSGSEVERERQGFRERLGVEARSARSRAMFHARWCVFATNTEMRTLPIQTPITPEAREPRKKHLIPLSAHSTYQFPSIIIIIHGGEIHVTVFRASPLSTCPHSLPLLFTTRSPSEIVSVLRNSALVFLIPCRCLRDLHLCWGIRVRHRF